MIDSELRRLAAVARRGGSPADWAAFAAGSRRAGRAAAAAEWIDAAEATAGPMPAAWRALAPGSLGDFSNRVLTGEPRLVGRLTAAGWDASGRHFYSIEDGRRLLEWRVATGECRVVAEVGDRLVASSGGRRRLVAAAPVRGEGRLIAALAADDFGYTQPCDLRFVGLEDGRWSSQLAVLPALVLALRSPRPGRIWAESSRHVREFRVRADGLLAPVATRAAPLLALGSEVVGLKRGRLEVYPADGGAPRRGPRCVAADKVRGFLGAGRFDAVVAGPGGSVARYDLLGAVAPSGPRDPRDKAAAAVEPTARVRLGTDRFHGWLSPDPSGRYLAVCDRGAPFEVIDLETGGRRVLGEIPRPRIPAWSPDGQTLAIPTVSGGLVLFGADGVGSPAATAAADDSEWIELRREGRFWRAQVRGTTLSARFGRVGAGGRLVTTEFPSADRAEMEFQKRVADRVLAGYRVLRHRRRSE